MLAAYPPAVVAIVVVAVAGAVAAGATLLVFWRRGAYGELRPGPSAQAGTGQASTGQEGETTIGFRIMLVALAMKLIVIDGLGVL